ncbi:hypothetical protein O6H91_03G114900 [Diphasiastrum complanatum]|uniref:Uncharacterized protein n=1 Tax=Diphasiastrum complanatum TaxID=34168 RepID=A0ACC2EAN0_DIPCM|nr:hypothetical protein O6H91_03G114900 [Diphasiastrum complanatum]
MVPKRKTIGRLISIIKQQPQFDEDEGDLNPPLLETRIRSLTSSYWELTPQRKQDNILSCVSFASKKSKNFVTILVGEDRQIFKIDPHILDNTIIQYVLEKTRSISDEESDTDEFETAVTKGRRSGAARTASVISLNCDAILFEHILWLLNNNDPSLHQLNLDELMEFYS